MRRRIKPHMSQFKDHPAELRRLFMVEMWERFSYFGLGSVMILFMTLAPSEGGLGWSRHQALLVQAAYGAGIYLFSIPFSLLADNLIGAANSVLIGAVCIIIGHLTLALPMEASFCWGLGFVAAGTGFLKPSISRLVGDLYHGSQSELKKAGMALFYMSISIGGLLGPIALGYIRSSKLFPVSVAWHLAFSAAAFGMAVALLVFIGHWKARPQAKVRLGTVNLWPLFVAFLGACALLWLFVWATPYPWVVWAVFGCIPASAMIFAFQKDMQRQAVWMVMLTISTIISAVVAQITSGLTLVIKDHVELAVFGISLPPEVFAGMFCGFIIIFTLLADRVRKTQVRLFGYRYVFVLGVLCLVLAMAIIGGGFALTVGKLSAWAIITAYAFKACAEVLVVPSALALMHDVSKDSDKSLTMSIWLLGAGLGTNVSKMLSLSMGATAPELGRFFMLESASIGVLMLLLWAVSRWLNESVQKIKQAS